MLTQEDKEFIKETIKPLENGLSRLDRKISNIEEDLGKLRHRVKDIESDQRTDASIARAVREMGFVGKIPQETKGSSFLEEIKDYY